VEHHHAAEHVQLALQAAAQQRSHNTATVKGAAVVAGPLNIIAELADISCCCLSEQPLQPLPHPALSIFNNSKAPYASISAAAWRSLRHAGVALAGNRTGPVQLQRCPPAGTAHPSAAACVRS
jgi:predicted alpha/beta hydrolase family esterase